MRKIAVIVGAVILIGAIAAAIIPMWTMSAGVGMSRGGYASVVLMVIFCFAVGGGLMFLIFFSSRHGYDDAAYRSSARFSEPGKEENDSDR
jgi:hypothetical protein